MRHISFHLSTPVFPFQAGKKKPSPFFLLWSNKSVSLSSNVPQEKTVRISIFCDRYFQLQRRLRSYSPRRWFLPEKEGLPPHVPPPKMNLSWRIRRRLTFALVKDDFGYCDPRIWFRYYDGTETIIKEERDNDIAPLRTRFGAKLDALRLSFF